MNETNLSPKTNRHLTVLLIVCYVLNVLYSAVLVPVYTTLCSDIVTLDTYWPNVLEIVYTLVELAVFFLTYAVLLYSRGRCGLRASGKKIALAAGAIPVKYLVGLFASWVDTGFTLPTDYGTDLLESGLNLLLELTQLFFILFLVDLMFRRAEKRSKGKETAILPCRKWNDLANPLLQSALCAGAVMSAVRVISRIIYDINYSIYISNTISAKDIFSMIIHYTGDLLLGAAFYFLLSLMFNCFYMKELKENQN